MTEDERKIFVREEIDAICEEFDKQVNHLVLLRHFLKNLAEVSNGAEPSYQFSKILKFRK